jgi:ATP-binding cassette subfamily B protein
MASTLALVVIVGRAWGGGLSIGDVILYLSAVRAIQGAMAAMVLALSSIDEHLLLFSRFRWLMLLPQPISVQAVPRSIPPLSYGVQLEDVWFRYTDGHPWVLKGANLFIPAGKCVALTGRNGAGKATLMKLLTRLHEPTQGRIRWDGIDIREFDPDTYRRHLGVILQDPFHYALTAHENIGLGEVSEIDNVPRVKWAAAKACVHDNIAGLPHGFETILSRWLDEDGKGSDLSGGEWQRVAVARLFMREPDLVILDEPLTLLDARAEIEIGSQLTEWTKNRTTLLVSHRPAVINRADIIAVLENGRIIDLGESEGMGPSHRCFPIAFGPARHGARESPCP